MRVLRPYSRTVEGKSKWYHQVFQGSFHLKRQAVPLNLTWVDIAFSCTKSYPGQVKRHSLQQPSVTVSGGSCPEIPGGTTYFCPRQYIHTEQEHGERLPWSQPVDNMGAVAGVPPSGFHSWVGAAA